MSKKESKLVGMVFDTNGGTKCKIISGTFKHKVRVKFLDSFGYEVNTRVYDLEKGYVKNPFAPAVCGVGYLGVGKYPPSVGGKKTLAYVQWHGVIRRSYDLMHKKKQKSYEKVNVCEEWHCFDTYAEWFYQQKGWDKGFQLDKDILGKGVRVYSPETCCLVPREINTAVKYGYVNEKGLLAGVSISSTGKFIASLNIKKKKTHVGVYDTQEEASAAYVEAKEAYVKELALEYKDQIEPRAFEALMNWTVYP